MWKESGIFDEMAEAIADAEWLAGDDMRANSADETERGELSEWR